MHCVLPAGGVSPDGKRWIAWKPWLHRAGRHLSDVFRRLFLERLSGAFDAGELQFFGELVDLNDPKVFGAALTPLRTTEWVVHTKKSFANPEQVLAYLARYTHRVAIANSRLVDIDETHVSFRCEYHSPNGNRKSKVVRLEIAEFIRRFLLHVLPDGFQRIRHYGLLANGHRVNKLALCRELLDVARAPIECSNHDDNNPGISSHESPPCPCCGGRMRIVEIFHGTLSRPYHVRNLDGL